MTRESRHEISNRSRLKRSTSKQIESQSSRRRTNNRKHTLNAPGTNPHPYHDPLPWSDSNISDAVSPERKAERTRPKMCTCICRRIKGKSLQIISNSPNRNEKDSLELGTTIHLRNKFWRCNVDHLLSHCRNREHWSMFTPAKEINTRYPVIPKDSRRALEKLVRI
jgi:hypothetical protein